MTERNNVPDVIRRRHDESVAGIVNTLQWVIIALTLAFIFRCFIAEAFRIPTGSMAETLSGDHYQIRCDMCGYKYDLGTDHLSTPKPKCPNCGYRIPQKTDLKPSHGDRIFVHKSIYQFSEPKRWDVVVFRYPGDPRDNYIKRLIALPGETLEIFDGDIYIDGRIQRKPKHVQEEMWMPLYDSDYVPYIYGSEDADNPTDFHWRVPFVNAEDSNWNTDSGYAYTLDSPQINTLYFDSGNGDKFRAFYAYNNTTRFRNPPICTDLKIRFDVEIPEKGLYLVGAIIEKHSRRFRASLDATGSMTIGEVGSDGKSEELGRSNIIIPFDGSIHMEFAVLDHQLIFTVGKNTLIYDFGLSPDSMGPVDPTVYPNVSITGLGKLKLSHIALFRDEHYVSSSSIRARKERPFVLGEDEFFMCGDNSMDSSDSRMWPDEGKGNYYLDSDGDRVVKHFRPGVVPREYLVGKAFFLYWGDAFEPFANTVPMIPNLTEMKIIYGGSENK